MLRYMTAGESHGKGLVTILEGVPAGLVMDEKFINEELARRMVGYGRGKRMGIEKDKVDIISGCHKGVTIGSPVSMVVWNKDFKIDKLPEVTSPRPGHADLAGMQKYGFKDARDVLERASARETAARVAAGSVAKMILGEFGIEFGIRIISHVTSIGGVKAKTDGFTFDEIRNNAEESDVRCADAVAAQVMREKIDEAKESGDTLGGEFEVIVLGVPPGLGSYVQWDQRMDAAIARAIVSIPAVKAVSIGSGVENASKKGSEVHDPISYDKDARGFIRASNNAGGLEGGVTNGEPVVVKGFMKPIATLQNPLMSVDMGTMKESKAAVERGDVCAVPACSVVAESVIAIEMASMFLKKFGGDSMAEIERNHRTYIENLKNM